MLVCKIKLWLWRQKGNLEIQHLQRYTYNVCIYNIDMGWLNIDMGWLRLVGSSKSQVSFAEYSLFYRALLQKRPIVWSIKKYAWACDVCQQIQMCMHRYVILHQKFVTPKGNLVRSTWKYVHQHAFYVRDVFTYAQIHDFAQKKKIVTPKDNLETQCLKICTCVCNVLKLCVYLTWFIVKIAWRKKTILQRTAWKHVRTCISKLLQTIGLFCKRAL